MPVRIIPRYRSIGSPFVGQLDRRKECSAHFSFRKERVRLIGEGSRCEPSASAVPRKIPPLLTPRAAAWRLRSQPRSQSWPSFRPVRLRGKSIFVGGDVCHALAGASWRHKLTAWAVLVYPAISNIDRDAERVSELACSVG